MMERRFGGGLGDAPVLAIASWHLLEQPMLNLARRSGGLAQEFRTRLVETCEAGN